MHSGVPTFYRGKTSRLTQVLVNDFMSFTQWFLHVVCSITAQHEMCEKKGREREHSPLQLCLSGEHAAKIHGENKGVQGVCFFHLLPPSPPLPSPAFPRVSITVSLHLSLARAGRSFLIVRHTHTCTNTHTNIEWNTHLNSNDAQSSVLHTTHTHPANSHMFHVELCKHNAVVSPVSVTSVKGATDKHRFPPIIHIHHFLSNSKHHTWNHRAYCMINGVN